MSVPCPNCQHVIKLKGVKAGRYAPKCPKCGQSFALTVSGEEGNYQFTAKATGVSAAKPAEKPVAAAAPAPVAKPKPAPAVKAPPPPVPEPPADPDQTAALLDQAVADDPDITSGWLSDEQPGKSFDQTEVHDPGQGFPEHTTAGEDDNADFSAAVTAEGTEDHEAATAQQPEEEVEEPKAKKKKKKSADDAPAVLGGYEIVEQLGKGGMGTVFLARQISLDRPVALKVMNERWASDPVFVARFTREAYAAAQLVHHNVIQIYDIGCDKKIHYFSMEYVKGRTLSDLVKEKKKLDVDEAVGYMLQAARGLKAAHDAGMVHRDVKPDNLMLNDLGVVKVADLGLVKTPGAVETPILTGDEKKPPQKGTKGTISSAPSVTNVGTAMGTPTYMAPEQARNAATVDHRADIYSLGCTLYVLLTGRVPFKGNTALEVMVKHQSEEPISPEVIAKRVPKEVSGIVLKMMAKKPEDRHQDMAAVIEDMEKFLGVSRVGPFTPGDEQADALEDAVKRFNNAPSAKIRSKVIPAFYLGCLALAMFCAFFNMRLGVSVVGLALMTALFTFIVRGITAKTHLFSKVREFILGSDWSDWLTWGVSLILVLILLWLAGILYFWMAFLVLAGAIAGAIRVLIDKPLEAQRKAPIDKAEKLLRQLRLRGLPEEAIRQFVCKYSGQHWEEFFETLFGYEALLQARKLWSRPEGGKPRPTHAAWRDPIVQWIDARQRAAQEARERRMLQEVERKKLEAEGVSGANAKEQAAQAAAVMVNAGAAMKKQAAVEKGLLVETSEVQVPVNVKEALAAAEKPRTLSAEEKKQLQATERPNIATVLVGPKMRFLFGAVLMALCFLWMQQSNLTASTELSFQDYKRAVSFADTKNLSFLPSPIDGILSGFPVGLAGLLLVLSALTRRKATLFFLLAAVIVLLVGPMFIPEVMGIGPRYVAMLAGFLIAEFGVIFARSAAKPKAA